MMACLCFFQNYCEAPRKYTPGVAAAEVHNVQVMTTETVATTTPTTTTSTTTTTTFTDPWATSEG